MLWERLSEYTWKLVRDVRVFRSYSSWGFHLFVFGLGASTVRSSGGPHQAFTRQPVWMLTAVVQGGSPWSAVVETKHYHRQWPLLMRWESGDPTVGVEQMPMKAHKTIVGMCILMVLSYEYFNHNRKFQVEKFKSNCLWKNGSCLQWVAYKNGERWQSCNVCD